MQALQIVAPNQFAIVEAPMPAVGEHDVLVEIEIVATCPRWDIHMMAGKDMFDASRSPQYPLPPGFPGHEAAGTVRQIGPKVRTLRVGDRVAALAHLPGPGAYAQYLAYPEHALLALPDHISFPQAVSFELLKCVVQGLEQFDDIPGKSVLVSGLGPAGILAMQAVAAWGAGRVVGIDVSEDRLAYVRGLGFGETMHAGSLGDNRFDLGYDCVGFAASVQNVLDHVREHVVIFGVQKGEVTFGERTWGKGTKLESFRGRKISERTKQLMLDLVGNKQINMSCIQTHNVPFAQYDRVLELLKSQEAIKVHFFPGRDFAVSHAKGQGR